jgi:hypothetical protein
MGFEWVVDNVPIVLPWKPPLKDMMVNGVEPGAKFIMQLVFSSSVMGAPPRCLLRYHMKAALKAFSFEQEPHAIVLT